MAELGCNHWGLTDLDFDPWPFGFGSGVPLLHGDPKLLMKGTPLVYLSQTRRGDLRG